MKNIITITLAAYVLVLCPSRSKADFLSSPTETLSFMGGSSADSITPAPLTGCENKSDSKVPGEVQLASSDKAIKDHEEAKKFIKELADKAITGVVNTSIPQEKREERFRELFKEATDLQAISRFVLGRYWKIATKEEHEEFLRVFTDLTVKTWARRFDEYSGLKFKITGTTPSKNKGQLFVESKIIQKDGTPVIARWRLIKKGDEFNIIDIIIEGASMARTYRNEYGAVIKDTGSVQGLIDTLKQKLKELDNNSDS